MLSFASAAAICRQERIFRIMSRFKRYQMFTPNMKFRTHGLMCHHRTEHKTANQKHKDSHWLNNRRKRFEQIAKYKS